MKIIAIHLIVPFTTTVPNSISWYVCFSLDKRATKYQNKVSSIIITSNALKPFTNVFWSWKRSVRIIITLCNRGRNISLFWNCLSLWYVYSLIVDQESPEPLKIWNMWSNCNLYICIIDTKSMKSPLVTIRLIRLELIKLLHLLNVHKSVFLCWQSL